MTEITLGQWLIIVGLFFLVVVFGIIAVILLSIKSDLSSKSKTTQELVSMALATLTAKITNLDPRVLALEAFIAQSAIRGVQFGSEDLEDFGATFMPPSEDFNE